MVVEYRFLRRISLRVTFTPHNRRHIISRGLLLFLLYLFAFRPRHALKVGRAQVFVYFSPGRFGKTKTIYINTVTPK